MYYSATYFDNCQTSCSRNFNCMPSSQTKRWFASTQSQIRKNANDDVVMSAEMMPEIE